MTCTANHCQRLCRMRIRRVQGCRGGAHAEASSRASEEHFVDVDVILWTYCGCAAVFICARMSEYIRFCGRSAHTVYSMHVWEHPAPKRRQAGKRDRHNAYYNILYYIILYYTKLYYITPCHTRLYHTILYPASGTRGNTYSLLLGRNTGEPHSARNSAAACPAIISLNFPKYS